MTAAVRSGCVPGTSPRRKRDAVARGGFPGRARSGSVPGGKTSRRTDPEPIPNPERSWEKGRGVAKFPNGEGTNRTEQTRSVAKKSCDPKQTKCAKVSGDEIRISKEIFAWKKTKKEQTGVMSSSETTPSFSRNSH